MPAPHTRLFPNSHGRLIRMYNLQDKQSELMKKSLASPNEVQVEYYLARVSCRWWVFPHGLISGVNAKGVATDEAV